MGEFVTIRFYEELNDHLPASVRKRPFDHEVQNGATAAEVIAAFGVTTGEVDLILVNGEPAALGQRLAHGDRLAVYPVFESFDIATVTRLPDRPLRRLRFVVTTELTDLGHALADNGYAVIQTHSEEELRQRTSGGWIGLLRTGNTPGGFEPPRAIRIRSAALSGQMRELADRLHLPIAG